MPAAATDLLQKVGSPGTATTLSAPGYTVGNGSITVGSTSNWPTDTGVTFAIDQAQVVNGVEVQIAGTYNEYVGTVASGTSVTNVSWVLGSGNRNYSAGALTRVYVPVSANRENRIVTWGLSHANQDGTLKTAAVQAALNTTTTSTPDWTLLAQAPTLSASNGQREYVLSFPGVDYTDRLSTGMKLKGSRTVAAQTQSTSLNGTNQYWSKTSPTGMTFTDDFVCGAWVYLTSYNASFDMHVVSRFNGTSGFVLAVGTTGQIYLTGYNGGGANYSRVSSYQSIPLNKWVHISAELDMSAFTATTTTSYVMIDGQDVPCSVTRGGTSPVALIQAGDLQIGASSGANNLLPGKVQDAFVTSAKLTQAQVRAFKDQKLTTALATTYSMTAAFPFDGNANDVSTNANNLTASGSATATDTGSAFDTNLWGIITKTPTYSGGNTSVTVFTPQGAGIPNETLGTFSYSTARAPYGFPAQQDRWSIGFYWINGINVTVASTSVWYNVTSLSLPAGEWPIGGSLRSVNSTSTATGFVGSRWTLSTGSSTESNPAFTVLSTTLGGVAHTEMDSVHPIAGNISNTSATTWYLNTKPISVVGTTNAQLSGYSSLIFYNGYL